MKTGSDCYEMHHGDLPLLISIPHDGHELPPDIAGRMTPEARALPDTDWHVRRLYDFASGLGCSVIAARYSRYVVDLNRPADDASLYPGQTATGLCPLKTFSGEPVYTGEYEPAPADRVARYWQPYHDRLQQALQEIRQRHGYALLWDAHSIQSRVPRLFEGRLPDLNLGTNSGASCAPVIEAALVDTLGAQTGYSWVANGRFRGGHITRHYGSPASHVHAVQLELAQCNYMDEATGEYRPEAANRLARFIETLLSSAVRAAAGHYSRNG
jgi:N-formylglutamate deformylase